MGYTCLSSCIPSALPRPLTESRRLVRATASTFHFERTTRRNVPRTRLTSTSTSSTTTATPNPTTTSPIHHNVQTRPPHARSTRKNPHEYATHGNPTHKYPHTPKRIQTHALTHIGDLKLLLRDVTHNQLMNCTSLPSLALPHRLTNLPLRVLQIQTLPARQYGQL
jgi:hypothetical protein